MVKQGKYITRKSRRSHVPRSVTELELVKAKSAIEQFIYSCSHTMRGPLKSISGLAFLLKNASGNNIDPAYCLKSIENTVSKLECVLNDLELFLMNSRHDLAVDSINVHEFLQDVLKEFKPILEEKKIRVNEVVNQILPLYTEVNRFREILTHIISNAISYQSECADNRTVDIAITVTLTDCVVEISDNGIGMDEKTLAKIFQLFYRGSEKSSGAGVGLYITREMINELEGEISVRSEVGKGSSFSCVIPNLLEKK